MKFSLVITLLIILVSVLFPFSYAQTYTINYNDNSTMAINSNNSQTLEDGEEIQVTSNEHGLPNFVLAARVAQNPDAFSFNNGIVYGLDDPNGVFVRINSFDWKETKYYEYLSYPNRIDFSESSIGVNIAFKLPISNTTSKIERLNAQFPVQYIITEDTQTEYQGYSSYPIVINGTEIQPNVFFTKFTDGTTSLVIENYPH